MNENKKQLVFSAMRSMMKPIVLLLLRNGVTFKEFANLCKHIFVEAASEEYGLRGRPTNSSRIAVLTGIDRKEVKRIRDQLDDNPELLAAQAAQDRITRLLTAWHQDQEFLGSDDRPKPLPITGERGSFAALVRRYGGDVPVLALLKELERLGLVSLQGETATVLSRDYFPARNDASALLRASSVIAELVSTLHHNLHRVDPTKSAARFRPRFERRASNNAIDPRHRKAFFEFISLEGQAFLERIDSWFSRHEIALGAATQPMRLSVGLFTAESLLQEDSE